MTVHDPGFLGDLERRLRALMFERQTEDRDERIAALRRMIATQVDAAPAASDPPAGLARAPTGRLDMEQENTKAVKFVVGTKVRLQDGRVGNVVEVKDNMITVNTGDGDVEVAAHGVEAVEAEGEGAAA